MHLNILIIVDACFQETKNIEGIFLNQTVANSIQLTADAFKKMNRLRLLKVGSNMVELPSHNFELPCPDLTYFCWKGYPLESMPSNFHANNLVELNLQFSNIRCLWKGDMVLLYIFKVLFLLGLYIFFNSSEVFLLNFISFFVSVCWNAKSH